MANLRLRGGLVARGRWEKVHTVSDYWGGPIVGVADVDGEPHVYEKVFSEEEDDYIGHYRVMPIDQELYSLLMESWSIFVRWRTAFDEGKTPLERTLPCLRSGTTAASSSVP